MCIFTIFCSFKRLIFAIVLNYAFILIAKGIDYIYEFTWLY